MKSHQRLPGSSISGQDAPKQQLGVPEAGGPTHTHSRWYQKRSALEKILLNSGLKTFTAEDQWMQVKDQRLPAPEGWPVGEEQPPGTSREGQTEPKGGKSTGQAQDTFIRDKCPEMSHRIAEL